MTCRASRTASDAPRRPLDGVLRGAPAPRSRGRLQQIPHPDEVVRRRAEEEDPVHQGGTAVVELPKWPDGLQPPEDLLDAFPAPLTHGVTRVAGGPPVDGTVVPRMLVLRDMGRDLEITATLDEGGGVIPLVAAERGAVIPGDGRGQVEGGGGLRGAHDL